MFVVPFFNYMAEENKNNGLTPKQELFVYEYLKDLNGQNAYKRAYGDNLSDEVARANGSRLLTNDNVKKAIDEKKEEILNKYGVSVEKIISELCKIAGSDITDYISFDGDDVIFKPSDEVDGSLISEVSSNKTITRSGKDGDEDITERINMKIKLHDKMKALELLGKYKSIFVDKTENTNVNMSFEEWLKQQKQ